MVKPSGCLLVDARESPDVFCHRVFVCLVISTLHWTPFRGYYEQLISPPISERRSVALGHFRRQLITMLWYGTTNHQPYDPTVSPPNMHLSLRTIS